MHLMTNNLKCVLNRNHVYFILIVCIVFCIYVHSRGLDGAETAQFAAGYGIAPFLDYGSNVLQYAGNRGLRNQNNLVAMNNLQGYGIRGGGGFGGVVQRGNFQNGAFLNKGSFPFDDYKTGYILKNTELF